MVPDHAFIRHFGNELPPLDGADGAKGIRITTRHSHHGHQPFRPLPPPTDLPPYHRALEEILPADAMKRVNDTGHLALHMVGDTGGIVNALPQQNVALHMENDLTRKVNGVPPSLFYHLGDVVYFTGEAEQYYPQFYEAYAEYNAPIVAIPGNHDGDLSKSMIAQGVPSLAAFVDNFCVKIPHHTADAIDVPRSAMNQPNVYWTLETPFATIVGLYTNVPDGGSLDDDQIRWLESEMAAVPSGRFLIVTMHHPIYSLDGMHSGSSYLHDVLEAASARAKRIPDAVFAGHVHNYQRFTRKWGSRKVPVVVAGGGGYHHLHKVAVDLLPANHELPFPIPGPDDATFETYCDDHFGFLRLDLTATTLTGDYFAVPGFTDPDTSEAMHYDSFTVDLTKHTVTDAPLREPKTSAAHFTKHRIHSRVHGGKPAPAGAHG